MWERKGIFPGTHQPGRTQAQTQRAEGAQFLPRPLCMWHFSRNEYPELHRFLTEKPLLQSGCQGGTCLVKSCSLQWIIVLRLEDLSHWLRSNPDTELQRKALLKAALSYRRLQSPRSEQTRRSPLPTHMLPSLWVISLTPLNSAPLPFLLDKMSHGSMACFMSLQRTMKCGFVDHFFDPGQSNIGYVMTWCEMSMKIYVLNKT